MTFNVIATGSTGNAVVINDSILIDCGVPYKALEPVKKDLKLVLLTHAHGDHFKTHTARMLHMDRPGLRFACCEWMAERLLLDWIDKRVIDVLEPRTIYSYYVGIDQRVEIMPEKLVHDVPNCGYHISFCGGWSNTFRNDSKERLFYATDTATLDGVEAHGYDLYLIEANHTREELEARAKAKLEAGQYAYEYRAAANHLSQEQALDWLYSQMGPHSQYVFLHQHQERSKPDAQ